MKFAERINVKLINTPADVCMWGWLILDKCDDHENEAKIQQCAKEHINALLSHSEAMESKKRRAIGRVCLLETICIIASRYLEEINNVITHNIQNRRRYAEKYRTSIACIHSQSYQLLQSVHLPFCEEEIHDYREKSRVAKRFIGKLPPPIPWPEAKWKIKKIPTMERVNERNIIKGKILELSQKHPHYSIQALTISVYEELPQSIKLGKGREEQYVGKILKEIAPEYPALRKNKSKSGKN